MEYLTSKSMASKLENPVLFSSQPLPRHHYSSNCLAIVLPIIALGGKMTNDSFITMELSKHRAAKTPFTTFIALRASSSQQAHFRQSLLDMGWSRPFIDIFIFTRDSKVTQYISLTNQPTFFRSNACYLLEELQEWQ